MGKACRLFLYVSFLLWPFCAGAQTGVPVSGKLGYLSYNAVFQAMPEYAVSQRKLADLKAKYDKEAQRSEAEFQRKFVEFLQGQKERPFKSGNRTGAYVPPLGSVRIGRKGSQAQQHSRQTSKYLHTTLLTVKNRRVIFSGKRTSVP